MSTRRNKWPTRQSRYINAVSVGFKPLEWTNSKERPGSVDFQKQELLELSLVGVPANASALRVRSMTRSERLAELKADVARVAAVQKQHDEAERRKREAHEAYKAE
jgi:phage head maturation protease